MVKMRIMKTRTFILTIAAGFMLMAFPACQKTELDPDQTGSDTTVETPEGNLTVFAASLEIPGSPAPAQASVAARMTLAPVPGTDNQVTPSWEEGDQIKIFYMDPATSAMTSVVASATQAGTSTYFTAEIPEGVSAFYAVHPASLDATVDADGNFVVPISKAAPTFTNACISIAKCGNDKIFRFKNLCSVLKFTVGTRGNVMKVSSIDGSAITGKINASLDADGNVKYADTPYTSTNNVVEMNLIPNGSVDTECYFPIIPGAQAAGVAIDYANVTKLPAAFADFAIPFERSHIYNVGKVDSHLITDYYITVTGSGDKSGKSWENAGDVNTFKTLVGYKADANRGKKYAQILRTKGTTFHFGAGKYVFGETGNDRLTIDFNGANGSLYSEFTIQGGYPANGGDEVSSDNVTTFSGDDKYGILNVFDRARVHINDVTFANAKGTAANAGDNADIHTENIGAALWMKQSATSGVDKAAPRVWLTRCVFDGNKTATASGSHKYEGGSAINIVHGAVYADKCVFKNNYDNTRNGCVKFSGADDFAKNQAYMFLNECYFTNNTVGNNNVNGGSVIMQNRKGGLLGMYNCTLNGNNPNGTVNVPILLIKSAIIANTTIVDDCSGNPIRFREESRDYDNQFIFANNIILQEKSDAVKNSVSLTINGGAPNYKLTMRGGNLIGKFNSTYYPNSTYITTVVDNEYTGYKYSDLDGANFTGNVFRWNGTLNDGTTTCNYMSKETMVNDVLKSSDINDSDNNVTFSITGSNGDETYAGFYTWLDSIGAIDKDAAGSTRPATGWTPGAYQAQ